MNERGDAGMDHDRGSEWSRWDLHVHSPASLVQHYGKGGGEAWENFLCDLEALPSQFRVIGLNDYLFLDGYRRVQDERSEGRLKNIDLVLPVVELRLCHFGGTESRLSRANMHVIFSDEVPVESIQSQFINGLECDLTLVPGSVGESDWSSMPTRESLKELGRQIRHSSPTASAGQSDLLLGFDNYNVAFSNVMNRLGNPIFRHKFFLAVGKTEWADIKWKAQSIGTKKNLINRPHFVFTAAASPGEFRRSREKLEGAGVNTRLLDCSDAHYRSDSNERNRIGNSFTWINALPTFEGLRHAFFEYESRVYVGDLPDQLRSKAADPSRYLDAITIELDGTTSCSPFFDANIELNSGFVAIVGNKGKGKSALTDAVGLLGGSTRSEQFSFLNTKRFRAPKSNLAALHQGTIRWLDGQERSRCLDQDVEPGEVELVQYLPQSYLESVCNEGPGVDRAFSAELGKVIFSHVPEVDRYGATSLEELLEIKTGAIGRRIVILRTELDERASELVRIEDELSAKWRRSLEAELKAKLDQLAVHEASRPHEVQPPSSDDEEVVEQEGRIEDLRGRIRDLELEIDSLGQRAQGATIRLGQADELKKELENLQHQVETSIVRIRPIAEDLGVTVESLVKVEIRTEALDLLREGYAAEKTTCEQALSAAGIDTPARRIAEARATLSELESDLAAPQRAYQAYLSDKEVWAKEHRDLVGSPTTPETVEYYQHRLKRLDTAPTRLEVARQRLIDQALDIHAELKKIAEIYADLYRPVQDFINSHPVASDRFSLSFEVTMVQDGLADSLFNLLNRNVSGSYSGTEESASRLQDQVDQCDFDSSGSVSDFLVDVDKSLHSDRRADRAGVPTVLRDQLRKSARPEDVYSTLYGLRYLRPEFWLRSEGKPISQLSPGQRGTLLLLFYLLVDRSNRPILLDQPEENLDNQTVHELLVPAIAEAKKRRQVIVVTHNPNLAVVGDADQVVVAEASDERFDYLSGAIEDPVINELIVAILEGTWPAFRNRDDKYIPTSIMERRIAPVVELGVGHVAPGDDLGALSAAGDF
jgi:ABC-type lipoprotein export system ATPase subunit